MHSWEHFALLCEVLKGQLEGFQLWWLLRETNTFFVLCYWRRLLKLSGCSANFRKDIWRDFRFSDCSAKRIDFELLCGLRDFRFSGCSARRWQDSWRDCRFSGCPARQRTCFVFRAWSGDHIWWLLREAEKKYTCLTAGGTSDVLAAPRGKHLFTCFVC